jgi:hypothetical protein
MQDADTARHGRSLEIGELDDVGTRDLTTQRNTE